MLPIKNQNILHKIHLVYRCNYLRDTIYAKDEGTAIPRCLIFCPVNYASEIISTLLTTKTYLQEVITKIDSAEASPDDRTDCLQFLLDLIAMFKQYQAQLLSVHRIRPQSLVEVFVTELKILSVVSNLFQRDPRIRDAPVAKGFDQPHKRFVDRFV